MTLPSDTPRTRGRPPSITLERIVDAGIAMGLPDVTFVGLAGALGVTHKALYKHVASLQALKRLIAEESFQRWEIPQVAAGRRPELKAYLTEFSASVQAFVKAHPGVTPYVLRRMAATQAVIDKITGHQRHVAAAYSMPLEHAQFLLATIAFHCIAAAETVYSVAGEEPVVEADRALEEAEMEAELVFGMDALITGALAKLQAESDVSGTVV